VPKRKADEVITIRFELQEHERKLIDSYLTASSVNGFMEALDKLTSFENLYVIVTIIELLTGKEILPGTPNDVGEMIDAIGGAFKDPDGSTGLAGFWDVNLTADYERFKGGLSNLFGKVNPFD
tara:strand:- start:53 stop:421 length:369 start_codon:yes stop_codon:yes gene_type:complete